MRTCKVIREVIGKMAAVSQNSLVCRITGCRLRCSRETKVDRMQDKRQENRKARQKGNTGALKQKSKGTAHPGKVDSGYRGKAGTAHPGKTDSGYRGKAGSAHPGKTDSGYCGKSGNVHPGKPDSGYRGKAGTGQRNDLYRDQQEAARDGTRKSKVCPVSRKCGGCKWIEKPYEEQLQRKEEELRRLLRPFVKTEPMIGMENPRHYRNKVHAVFGEDRRHNIISGTYEAGSHDIVPLDKCMIENEKADEIILSIRKLLPSFKIKPYNEDSGYGLLRHVLIRTGHATGEIMVVLVLVSPILPSKKNFVKALCKLHPEITTIVLNVNDRRTSMVLGEQEHVIYGKGYIEDILCGKTFRISPRSFYQVNPVQTEKLYRKALEYAGLHGTETVLDAYCGTGTIGMIVSDKAKQVIGVELNAGAVKDARINAMQNNILNIQFYQNDAGRFLTEMAEQQARLDVLFMDPPRSGSDEAFLGSVVKLKPEKIVYISCNPQTLVTNLRYLVKKGYQVKKGAGVDMFPFTESIEAVVQLTRKGPQ